MGTGTASSPGAVKALPGGIDVLVPVVEPFLGRVCVDGPRVGGFTEKDWRELGVVLGGAEEDGTELGVVRLEGGGFLSLVGVDPLAPVRLLLVTVDGRCAGVV